MNNEATGLIDETQLKDLSFKIQVKQMPKKEGILLHEVITIDKFSALGEDDVQFTHFHVIYGSSSLGIFNAFGVDEVAGLKRKDCEDFLGKLKAQGKTERDGSFIAGLVNFVGDQIFMFFNVERLSFKGFAVRVLPHEALHLARVLITLYKNSWVRENLNTPNWWEDPRSKFVDMNDDNEEFYAETLERCSAIAVDGWTRVTGTSCFADGGMVEEKSDVKKVLDSFSQSVGQGFYGAKKFVTKATAMPIVVKEKQSTAQNKMPTIMKTGGRLKYWKENEHRLSSPRSNIERELLVKAQYDDNDFAGNFGWMTPNNKYAEGYLLKLDDFDKQIISSLKFKKGEKVFRYINRASAIGGMKPLIKINVDKSLLYFLDSESADSGEIIFETRGLKADYINLIEGQFAKGGRMENYKGTITNDSAAHILKSLGFNFQYQHDSITGTRFFGDFSKLKEAQNALYDNYRIETEIRGVGKMGLKELIVPNQMVDFAKGGTTMKKRYKIYTYHGGEQSDEIHYVDTLTEARTLAAQAEHAQIIDQNTNEEVFAKGGKINFDSKEVQFIEYNGEEIMYEPHFKEFYVNDVMFHTFNDAKKYIDSGSPMPKNIKEAYKKGLFKQGGLTNQMVILKDKFQQREDQPNRVYHSIEGVLGGYWFKAKTDNSFKHGYASNGIKGGCVYELNVWRGGNPVGRDRSTSGGHISEDYLAGYHNKWGNTRPRSKEAKEVVESIVSWLEKNICDLKREWSSVKFANGGITQMPYYSNMTKQEILTNTVVYDNGGDTMDRYTVFTPDGSVFGMSETAQGFNLYIGDDSEIEKGSHLGKRLKFVPKEIEWAVLDRMKEEEFAKGGNVGGYSKIDLVVKKPSGDEEYEVGKFKRTGDAIISANALGKNAPKNYEYYVSSTNKYSKGGLAGNFDYMDLPITYTLTDSQGNLVLKTKSFNKAVDTRTLNSFTEKGKLKLVATDKSGNSKVIGEGITEIGEVFAKGGQISTGDWVTYKTDGKRYKVKRVLNNNMIEIASGKNVLVVSMDDVETATKFFRAKFVKVPTNVQLSYKIGDRVKFATKKGEEKGVIKLYKYIPTTNKIMYVIKTDSGWNANVYQDNVALESSSSATTTAATPKAPRKTAKPLESGLTKGDKVLVKDAPSLIGTITEVLSNDMVNVDVQDSLGITMKVGVVSNMIFSKSELQKA